MARKGQMRAIQMTLALRFQKNLKPDWIGDAEFILRPRSRADRAGEPRQLFYPLKRL